MRRRFLLLALSVAAVAMNAMRAMAQDKQPFKPEELDQILAPIALYPDAVLSQILMAASYPLEVVEAARWSKANPTLKGDAAVTAVKDKTWDVSVKSLVAFPDVLAQMNEHLDWTQKLGDAMIGQEADVADSIQRLRAKASAAGNLQTTPQQTVTTQGSGDNIQYIIQPTNPDVVYTPSYDPNWAYGAWSSPAYPPVWYPFAGALARGFLWGAGFAAAGALFGGWNWGGHGNSYANVNVNKAVNIDRSFDRNQIGQGGRWNHQVDHRKGVGYRDNATRQRFNQAARPGAAQRQEFRGRLENTPRAGGGPAGGARPGGGIQAGQRPAGGAGIGGQRPGAGGGGVQRPGGGAVQRPAGGFQQRPGGVGNRPGGALGGVNRGQAVNREGARGRQQMNRAGGGGARAGGGGGGRPGGGGGGGRPGGGGGGRPGGGGGRR
jgi:hypothetical protein